MIIIIASVILILPFSWFSYHLLRSQGFSSIQDVPQVPRDYTLVTNPRLPVEIGYLFANAYTNGFSYSFIVNSEYRLHFQSKLGPSPSFARFAELVYSFQSEDLLDSKVNALISCKRIVNFVPYYEDSFLILHILDVDNLFAYNSEYIHSISVRQFMHCYCSLRNVNSIKFG